MSTLSKNIQNKVEYGFDKVNHFHYLLIDGVKKPLTGCTQILSVISKPALIQWSANMAVDYIDNEFHQISADYETPVKFFKALEKEWSRILQEARVAHRKRKEKAGSRGKEVHDLISKEIQNAIDSNGGIILEKWKEQYDSKEILNFIDWAVKNKVKFLSSEKNIYSENLYCAGICDIICEIDNEIWLADIKTGGVYPEAFWQISGYQIMIEEMGLYSNIKGHIILGLLKDGSFVEKRSISNEENKKAFLACLDIYRIKQKVEGNLL